MTSRLRLAAGVIGVFAIAYGGALVLTGGRSTNIVSLVTWLAAGLIGHDAIIAPAVAVGGWLVGRTLPRPAQAPVMVGAFVGGSLILVSAPLWLSGLIGQAPAPFPQTPPIDYLRHMGLLLLAIAGVTALACGWRIRAARSTTQG
jgi:hypothetical protein